MSDSAHIPDNAIRAAESGDFAPLLDHLYRSGAIDGVTRLLQRKYQGSLDKEQIADCVADAVEATYRSLRNRDTVRHPVAFLLKVASNKAADVVDSEYFAGKTDVDVDRLASSPWAPSEPGRSEREEARTKAVAIARSYVPRLGQENIQRVMTVLLDAAENNIADLPHARISAVTGISVVAVRQLVSRGLKRLCAIAKKDGLHIEKYMIDDYGAIVDSDGEPNDDAYGEQDEDIGDH